MINRSKIAKSNITKGKRAERESAEFWSKELGTKMRRSPASGAFAMEMKGDLLDLGDSILKEYIIERKCGNQVPKKIYQWMEKLCDESQGNPHFLEMSRPYQETYIVISRKHFARLLKELQGYQKNETQK